MKTKILVIRAGALGDVILATGIVRELNKFHSGQCSIDVATEYPEVFKNNPYVNLVINKSSVNQSEYDQVIDLDLCYEMEPNQHVLDAYSKKVFGIANFNVSPELFLEEEHTTLPKIDAPYVVVHMRNHYWPSRNLPQEFWVPLISNILAKTNYTVVQIGSGQDLAFGGLGDRLINTVGKLGLHQSHALIGQARAFVGADAGALHIAACTQTPILAMYTSVRADYREPKYRTAPHISIASDIDCYGCVEKCPVPYSNYYCARGDEQCVRSFDPESVYQKLIELIKE
jgi:ADP-heptose:LPS heptosyltransferase